MNLMSKTFFNFDERVMDTFYKICAVMYGVTLFTLMGIQLYRQFVLQQAQGELEDIAILLTINVIVLFGSVLYLTGVVNPKRIKPGAIVAGYIGFVLLGLAFTIIKYSVFLGQPVSLVQVWEYLKIVVIVSGALALLWGVLAFLGSRRIEKQIE
jgi:hypothetical protein